MAGKVANVPPIFCPALAEGFLSGDDLFREGRNRDSLQVGQSGLAAGDSTLCAAVEPDLGLDLKDGRVLVEVRRTSGLTAMRVGLTSDKGLTEAGKMGITVSEAGTLVSRFSCAVLPARVVDGMDDWAGSFSIPAFLSLLRSSSTAGLMFWAAGELLMLVRLMRVLPSGCCTRRSGMSVTMGDLEDEFLGRGLSKHSSQHGLPLRSTLGELEMSVRQ